MAYEAVDSLQQTLLLILQRRDDHLITPPVKQQIISIHDKAVVLQFNLKRFPDKETIREVANTTEDIIQYLFFPQSLSDFGSIDPTVRLSDQLGKLAEELDSTVGYVVDCCKIKDVQIARALVDESLSDSPPILPLLKRKDVVAGNEKVLLSVMDYFPTPILRRHFLPQVLQNHPRISVSLHDLHLRDSTHNSCTTSIICIPQRGYRPKGSVENFSSLRVLHVLRRNDHSYWELGQVFELIYLTYLASSIPDSIVPPAIAKLQNLQTLIIYRFGVHLPVEIWRLRQLRHLIAFSFHPLLLPEGATLSLDNLQTLSMATDFVCSERMVDMIPNITKLGICYSEDKLGVCYHLDNLKHLLKLEKLKLDIHNSFVPCLSPVFPLSLKKLELSGGWISWSDMTIVGSLPNLQVLKLKKYACYGERWATNMGEFHMLIHLLIDESNLKCWTTEYNHFPRLQRLVLHRCPCLDGIPIDIADIRTLELIEIDDRNQSLLYSAKRIQKEQRENWGNDELKVMVKRS
ncbi:hypothetical protein AAHA92_23368 [Salvia divinorum]|uniref:Disease resistance R13L4/SHOC-2-like LRR domain-containing protein n=1 Tax=Salvia divinorum TaxID=28513 RepID=A0ABD1GRQ9_SALDI